MEKVAKNDAPIRHRSHSVNLEDRKKISMTGVDKVVSSSENVITLLTSGGGVVINGKNLKINMYNVQDGSFSAEGEIDSIKYSTQKTPILKRMFK